MHVVVFSASTSSVILQLPELNQTYYQDIVEERAITNLCGYALCGLKIQELRKGTYYINNKNNKVYDITERKVNSVCRLILGGRYYRNNVISELLQQLLLPSKHVC